MQNWIESNYEFLQKWAKIWSPHSWRDLISHYYLWLYDNWDSKMDALSDDERLRYTQTWLKNTSRWSNSSFNKLFTIKDSIDVCEVTHFFQTDPVEEQMDINIETDREDIRDFLLDIKTRFLGTSADQVIKSREIYLRLETTDRVLWDLYFTNMLSMRDISKKINIPLSSVYILIKELKEKIKREYGLD